MHSETDAEKKRLERWKAAERGDPRLRAAASARALGRGRGRARDEDIVPQELLETVEQLDREEYDVDEMIDETFLDLDQIVHFLEETRKFEPKHDDKLQKLIRLLKSKELAGQKVLIFTEFADTARYLQAAARRGRHRRRRAARQRDQEEPRRRHPALLAVLQRHRARPSSQREGTNEIRVLISTDVLSEGLNLQDASRMINYDIHWNPVRLMQRIGRVDRRMNPEVEERLDRRSSGGRRVARQGELLELPAARRAERDPDALHARSRRRRC